MNRHTGFLCVIFFLCNSCLFAQKGEWTWMHGESGYRSQGVFGLQGDPSPSIYPPSLYEATGWTDKHGNFWLFGGDGPSDSLVGTSWYITKFHDNLWKYDPSINTWTWISGSGIVYNEKPGRYGLKGVASVSNYPGGRALGGLSWTDSTGNFWMFGGKGFDSKGEKGLLNDLWRYDPELNLWTWISGTDQANSMGSFGVQGVASPSNCPPARSETKASWVDNKGNFWLFGGNSPVGTLGDLWMFDTRTYEWTWVKGSNLPYSFGSYGVKGVPDPLNLPPARHVYSKWKDKDGNLWMFGGNKDSLYNGTMYYTECNDMWKYDIKSNTWTWMHGTSKGFDQGHKDLLCAFSPLNLPEGRYENSACWTDACGRFWMFGGKHTSNEVWCYDPVRNEWAFATKGTLFESYGVKGVSDPSNCPVSRDGSVSWMDKEGNLWFQGGNGYNDLWRFVPDGNCPSANAQVQSGFYSLPAESCFPATVSFKNTSGNANSFEWDFGDGSVSDEAEPVHTYESPGTYPVRLIAVSRYCSGAGKRDTSFSTVTISKSSFQVRETVNGATCRRSNASIELFPGNGTPPYTYLWSTGDTTRILKDISSGNYTVDIRDGQNCLLRKSFFVKEKLPVPFVRARTEANNILIGKKTVLHVSTEEANTVVWSPDVGLSDISARDPVASPTATIRYYVSVSNGHCTVKDSVTLYVRDDCAEPDLFIPNAFTPNDDGENDFLSVKGSRIKEMVLVIFSRWGEKIFESRELSKGWDGTWKGEKLPLGVYAYSLKIICHNGEEFTRSGNITLIR